MAKTLEAIHLPNKPPSTLWNVTVENNTIISITPSPTPDLPLYSTGTSKQAAHPLLLPTLCHPHIHLDKPYLLCSSHPRYQHLIPTEGTFKEALSNTSKAKELYNREDLLLRGSQLIIESIKCGVTSMRTFVEVDHVTNFKALEVGIELKKRFKKTCQVQLVVFAQDPIMSSPHGEENQNLMIEALKRYAEHINVLGSTPYVEDTDEAQLKNIKWSVDTASKYDLHLDFHMDYNLDPSKKSFVWDTVELLKSAGWSRTKTVVFGHCTRLTLFTDSEMSHLAEEIKNSGLKISFVALPTSDLFMQGRPSSLDTWGGQRPRGTLQVLEMIKRFGFNVVMGVNNVGNAFTPSGNVDPLRLASLGVGIYQAGTEEDAEVLMGCVGWRARVAIGLEKAADIQKDGVGPWVIVENRSQDAVDCDGETITVMARQWRTVRDVVWDPPEIGLRRIVR